MKAVGVTTLYADFVPAAEIALEACRALLCAWSVRVEAATLGRSTTREAPPPRLRCKLTLVAPCSRLPRLNAVAAVSINPGVYPSLLQAASDMMLPALKVIVKVALAATLDAHLALNGRRNAR